METGDFSQSVLAARFHPGGVAPLVLVDVPHHRGRFGRHLAVERVGIGLELLVSGEARAHVVLVRGALAQAGDEKLPDAAVAPAHGMAADVPIVELAGHGDAFGVGRPDREAHAADAVRFRRGARPACGRPRAACLRCAGRGRYRRSAGRSGKDLRSRCRARPTACARISVALRARRSARRRRSPASCCFAMGQRLAANHHLGRFGLRQERAHFPARLPDFFLRTLCGPRMRKASPW